MLMSKTLALSVHAFSTPFHTWRISKHHDLFGPTISRSTRMASVRGSPQLRSRAHGQQLAPSLRPSRACRSALALQAQGKSGIVEPGSLVLVAGATGGVGQLVTAKLIERGYRVRALTRGTKGNIFGDVGPQLEMVQADLRSSSSTPAGLMDGVQAVCCCTGTTAFPSSRWDGDNGPENTDLLATSNLIKLTPKSVGRFVYVTSAGVERQGQLPWLILNAFGVLKFKRQSEVLLEQSGLPFTIFRPGRLTDGPYTSYDLNTLLKATAGERRAVQLVLSDRLAAETSRIAVAEAVVQCLACESAQGKKFSVASVAGVGPGTDAQQWQALFAGAQP